MGPVLGLILRCYEEAHHCRGVGLLAWLYLGDDVIYRDGFARLCRSQRYIPSAAHLLMCMGACCRVSNDRQIRAPQYAPAVSRVDHLHRRAARLADVEPED